MNLVLGVGNEQKRDDGVGPFVAKHLNAPGWEGVNCSTAPENFGSVVKQKNPTVLAIVDATEMCLAPGEIRIIPRDRIGDLAISTHSMPLSLLVDHLAKSAGEVLFIGVQPKTRVDGKGLTPEVMAAADHLLTIFRDNRLKELILL